MRARVYVIGGGIIGLATAIKLLEAGYQVLIMRKDPIARTVSMVAAAMWHLCLAYPLDRVLAWGRRTYEVLEASAYVQGSGIIMMNGLDIFTHNEPDPLWRSHVRNFYRAHPDELPPGFVDGYGYSSPVADMRVYLPYLQRLFMNLGGRFVMREIASIEEALDRADIVVNCAGLAAGRLVGDATVYPIRGQIVRVSRPPRPRFIWDDDEHRGFTYIIPRANDCILGGTTDTNSWNIKPDQDTAQDIIERCARLEPVIRDCTVLEHLVGLRPARPTVRLEAELLADSHLLIHNYGHGGSGVTLAWGCAEEVVKEVGRFVELTAPRRSHLVGAASVR